MKRKRERERERERERCVATVLSLVRDTMH